MHIGFYIYEPRWARYLRTILSCLAGHDMEEIGERKPIGIIALVAGNYNVSRCRRCGHYRERLQPGFFVNGSRLVIDRVRGPVEEEHNV